MMRRIEGRELMEILSAKAFSGYSNTDTMAVWTDGKTYTINDDRVRCTPRSIIASDLSAEDVSYMFEALGDDQNG